MSRRFATLIVMGITVGASGAHAQELDGGSAPARVEVTYMPAGASFFTSKDDSNGTIDPTPSFGNYTFGTAVTVNLNRVVGIEGEIGSMLSTTSSLQFGNLPNDVKAPNMLGYTGNVVVSLWPGHSVVPYATGGVGGLTMFERPGVGVLADETFLTGNAGGGLKWYAPNHRWGLRADYRFAATRAKDDAPAFFGRDTRYAHRVYAGVIIDTVGRRRAPQPLATTTAAPAPPPVVPAPPPPPPAPPATPAPIVEVARATAAPIVLDEIYFDFDRAVLREDALPGLERAVNALRQNPSLRLRLEGHASNEGTAEYNLALGERRSNAVRDYLLTNGIDGSRLQALSYGEEQPKYDNSHEETRRLNRRVAFAPDAVQSSEQQ